MIIRIGAHGGFASVAGSRAEVFSSCGHGLRVVDLLHLDAGHESLPFELFLFFYYIFVALEFVNFFDHLVDFGKDLHIIFNSTTVFVRENMF